MSSLSAEALARTVQLIADDVFGQRIGEDQDLEDAIVAGLRATTIRLAGDSTNLSSDTAQTALVTLFGLLAAMGTSLDLDIPNVQIRAPQPPLRGRELRSALLEYGNDLIPDARVGVGIGTPDLTFVFGDTPVTKFNAVLRVMGDEWRCTIASDAPHERWRGSLPFGALAAAGAAAAEAFRAALRRISLISGRPLPLRPWFHLDLKRRIQLDLSVAGLPLLNTSIGDVDIVSGGAITTAALYCLLRVPELSGRVRVIEPDRIDMSNLNRYILARRSDCDEYKVDVLSKVAESQIEVERVAERFNAESMARIGALRSRVLVGVDNIPSRWAVQAAARGWVCVAGTSHLYALVTTHPPGQPCAGCAHPRDDDTAGPIPTISFVSFWAGLCQALALLIDATSRGQGSALNVWPTGLYGARGLHRTGISPRADCPVGCTASIGTP